MSEDGPYAAVTLILGEDWHCRLSGAVEGELFLLPEAPELPLSGCSDSSQCRCQYQHFPDRREKILNRLRSMRAGRLNDGRFGSRMRGEGVSAGGHDGGKIRLVQRVNGFSEHFAAE